MKYNCSSLESKGVKEGDIVTFMPDSEYLFRVDGKKLYRIPSKNIIAYESQRD